MVCHAAESVNSKIKLLDGFLQDQVKPITVGIAKEDVFTSISAKHYVIHRSGKMYAEFPSHRRSLLENVRKSSLTPAAAPGKCPKVEPDPRSR